MKTLDHLNYLKRSLDSNEDSIAFTFSAMQTTLLSFYVAHYSDANYLAVFSFLLSVHYFAISLLRRNVVEPYFQFQDIARITQAKWKIAQVLLFIISFFIFNVFVNGFYKLTLSQLSFTIISIFWELRKAELRILRKVRVYMALELFTCLALIIAILLGVSGLTIQIKYIFIGLALLKLACFTLTKSFATAKFSQVKISSVQIKFSTFSYAEFFYISTLIMFNAYLLSRGYSGELGEIQSTFLFLFGSTFSVSALRNSLSIKQEWSRGHLLILMLVLGNISVLLLTPPSILKKLIPSFPAEPGFLVLLVSLDILGSLIFSLMSIKLLKLGNMKNSANARLLSTIVLVIMICFFLRDNSSSIELSFFFAVSSLSGAAYLLIAALSSRHKRRIWSTF